MTKIFFYDSIIGVFLVFLVCFWLKKGLKSMLRIINIAQIIVSILLITSILVQNKGAGLSSTFGGDFGGYYSKRGFEKFLVWFSIGLSVFFMALAIANLILTNQIF